MRWAGDYSDYSDVSKTQKSRRYPLKDAYGFSDSNSLAGVSVFLLLCVSDDVC
mgnify:CR=1 FL=1